MHMCDREESQEYNIYFCSVGKRLRVMHSMRAIFAG